MSDTLEEKVKSLSSNIESLTKSVDQLNNPDFSGVRHDAQGRLTGYWEQDDSLPETEKTRQPHIKSLRKYPG